VFFEILKMKIRSVSIAYSIRKSRDEKEKTPFPRLAGEAEKLKTMAEWSVI
jgi:hypothetical protein